MQIELTAEQNDFIRRALAEGRVKRPEEALQQALMLWIERERGRDEILSAIDAAEASLARGEGVVITKESMRQLADDVKQRGRARMAGRQRRPAK